MNFFSPFALTVYLIFALSLMGLPIGLSMIASSVVYLFITGQDMGIAAEQLLQGLNNTYTLLAIPLFILAAEIMNMGSLTDRLLRFCNAIVGRFRGGLGHVNILSSLIFSGMSGSAIADAAGVGRMVINMMTKDGRYTPAYAAAITSASAVIGPIIPPSIPLVLYGLISDASIGFLFMAGVVPGLLLALVLMAMNAYLARVRNFPVETPVPLRELPGITWRAIPALMMPVVLLGGIYSGVMTPTEAAAVAALYALVISVVLYRSVTPVGAYRALLSSGRSMASIGILIAGALVFNYVVTREDIPQAVSQFMTAMDLTPMTFLLMVNVLLLLLGALLEGGTILLVIVPILIPTAKLLGIDMVHFGVVVTVNLMIGLITPPYGLLLFIMGNITGESIKRIVKETLPFVFVMLAALAFLTYVPGAVLWLPRQFGYQG
ncbi:tripartite ATP-independent transporter DctM subunit [Hydrogenophaga palleronii]|uniref:TRAP transporter large permease protein n=1 Tax=Hydrogenophaga palleronii TaxID=65655 RepID=A0ABU1WHD1_9BURK|nr:TRAP transporter large permease [Hydrogenophaga palleronii]MDR7148412.1 tripartite ATP-independent transporter DctM subunit [Hydrogenophaga palleronii]